MPKRATPDGIGKRVPLMVRTTPSLRSELENAAGESGRSLAQEVESRLERSFNDQKIFEMMCGNTRNANTMVLLFNLLSTVRGADGGPWHQDPLAARVIAEAAKEIVWSNADNGATAFHILDHDEKAKDYIIRQAMDIAELAIIKRLSIKDVTFEDAQFSARTSALEEPPQFHADSSDE